MTERQAAGIDEVTRRLYARMWEADDGTWWQSLQPGASGYGMVPWIRGRLSVGDFYYILNSKQVPSLWRAEYGVAFVHWTGGHNVGPMLRLEAISTHDHFYSDPLEMTYGFSSLACNSVDTSEAVMNSVPELWVPAWSVTPIDSNFFWSWCPEAEEVWMRNNEVEYPPGVDGDGVIDDIEEYADHALSDWACCSSPEHAGFCHLEESLDRGIEPCQALILQECPNSHLEDRDEHYEECCDDVIYCTGQIRVIEIDEDECNCGLTNARVAVLNHAETDDTNVVVVNRNNPLDLVFTEAEVYYNTLNYMFESWLRGWRLCARLAQEDMAAADSDPKFDITNKESHWFYSCWHQLAPFSDFSGPERLAAIQLPLSINSATLRAS